MKYIVYDLEFTVSRTQKYLSEIIEIGAIELRVLEGRLVMTDLFHTHVKPTTRPYLSKLTTEFTGITQEQVSHAPRFNEAAWAFYEWLGAEEYFLCSWGPDDKYQMIKHCHHHSIDLNLLQNYNDIQLQFTCLQETDINQRLGLVKSLALLDIPFFGKQHNALDDAFNTAKLFVKVFPKLTFQKNRVTEEFMFTNQIVYSSGQKEENRPFGQLASLLGMVT
ncbi:3'-5' exonuclease [Paenibacillus lignilyticus]|uniref:Exonuclease domain-containing protein n=1 Tax=Paenibacillus lignilyticus TaxID=1172615 RepID=A0ABS5CK63_9BACL|nr:3'-5' exonuclease [Paenibacillus lignilyticus]MBP3966261.1 exonuclease domain-containing protein [Paenibacillus lignilyticus]